MIKYFCDFCDKETKEINELKPTPLLGIDYRVSCSKCYNLVEKFRKKTEKTYKSRCTKIREEYFNKLKEFIGGSK